ncbi:hypothetical protein BG003_011553, partial [Podila horticola]
MFRNTTMDNLMSLFCLVDGEATSNAFSVEIDSSKTVDGLKKLIKTEKTNDFIDIDANHLTLWRVFIPLLDDDDDEMPIILETLTEKKKLRPATYLDEVFNKGVPRKTIHIIVQRPPP